MEFSKNEQLFTYLISTFQSSAYIALGKKENPITKNIFAETYMFA